MNTKETTLIKLDSPELEVIEKSRANQIKATFEPMVLMLAKFEDAYNEIIEMAKKEITVEVIAKAKRVRLDIGKVRIETGKLKDKQKEYIKLEDRAIMGTHNVLVWAVKEKEDKLKEIELTFETQEKERLEKLQGYRAEMLRPYVEDAFERDLSKFADDEFEALYSIKKKEHDEALEAERIAEEARVAKEKAAAIAKVKLEAENKKLKEEAEKREEEIAKQTAEREAKEAKEKALRDAERAKEDKIRADKEAKDALVAKEAKAVADAKEAKYQAELQAQRDKAGALKKAEEAKRKKLEQELESRKQAELKIQQEADAKIQLELGKNDEDKLQDLISDLNSLKGKYEFESDNSKQMYINVEALIDKVVAYIEK